MSVYTTAQTAAQLGITRRAVIAAISHKHLRAARFGRMWVVEATAIEEYRRDFLGRIGRKPGMKGSKHV